MVPQKNKLKIHKSKFQGYKWEGENFYDVQNFCGHKWEEEKNDEGKK